MDQNFETLMKTLNDQMARLNQRLSDQLNQKMAQAEARAEAHKAHAKFNSSRPNSLDPRAYDHDLAPESSPRSPYPYLVDSEEGPIRSTQPYAPTFDGRQEVYIDWEESMDHYFEYTRMSELEKLRLAIHRLTRYAK